MNKKKIKKDALIARQITVLREKINFYRQQYFVFNKSVISDEEYDNYFNKLKTLERKYPQFFTPTSPTQSVGSYPFSRFNFLKPKHHSFEMLSLDNCFDFEGIKNFEKRLKKIFFKKLKKEIIIDYFCELKIDGISISLTYENGFLKQALTRGDGIIGEDVTKNIFFVKGIPSQIICKDNIEVRGEIFVSKGDFDNINKSNAQLEKNFFANPRNLASGSIRNFDPHIIKNRKLQAFVYQVISKKKLIYLSSQADVIYFLRKNGFAVENNSYYCKSLDTVFAYIQKIEKKRNEFPYWIDGIVVKVNNLNFQQISGSTSSNYRWAIAYKFKEKIKTTILKAILQTTGRTGKITYLAKLVPLLIDGSKISFASLNNANYIVERDFRIGCEVRVKKAGEIIPMVIEAVKNDLFFSLPKWSPFSLCAVCNSSLVFSQNKKEQFCVNKNCLTQHYKRLLYFVSKSGLDIKFLNEKTVKFLFDNNFISIISDFYFLKDKKVKFLNLKGFSDKKVNLILDNIEKSKINPLFKIISAFGINKVGKKTAVLIAQKIKSLDNIFNLTYNDLVELEGIGDQIAREVMQFLNINKDLILFFCQKNFHFYFKNKDKSFVNVVLTGRFSKSRSEVTTILEKKNFFVQNNILINTRMLIVGKKPSLKKINLAKKMKIDLLEEKDFLQKI